MPKTMAFPNEPNIIDTIIRVHETCQVSSVVRHVGTYAPALAATLVELFI